MKITEYRAQARKNENKNAAELRPGDFIYAATGLGKDYNFTDFVDGLKYATGGAALCKVVGVVDVPENYDLLADWTNRPAPAHRGGSQSDDVPDDKPCGEYTREDYDTVFQLVTVYRKPSGQWLAVDCQGYDYWRYVYMPQDWRHMYATEYAEAVAYLKQRDAEREAEEQARLKAHAEALSAHMNALRAAYPELKEGADNARSVGANVRKFFKKHFPELAVKISVRPDYWREAWEVSAEAPEDTPQEVRDHVAGVCKVWRDTMPSGELWENERGSGETNICPMTELFGRVKYGVTPCYYL